MIFHEKPIVNILPRQGSFLRAYVKYAAGVTDANIAYHVVGGLAILASVVPPEFHVTFGPPLYPGIFYGMLVGPSTMSRKSAAIALAERVVRGTMPTRVGSAPGSVEGFTDELQAAHGQQTLFFSEYGAFLAQSEQGYFRAIKTKLTEAYDGNPLGRMKANGKGVKVERPRLVILAGIAPGYLESHAEPIDFSEGFFARHFTVFARRQRYYDLPYGNPDGELALIEMAKALRPGADGNLGAAPCLGLTASARALWRAWQKRVEQVAQSGISVTAPAVARAPAMAIKIGALLAWDLGLARCAADTSWLMNEECVYHATQITDLHIASVVELGGLLATDRDMRNRRQVLEVIRQSGPDGVTKGAVCRDAKLLKRRAEEMLQTLIEEGAVTQLANRGGGEIRYVDAALARPDTVEDLM